MTRARDKPGVSERKPHRGIGIYYSGTGNSAKVANLIYKGMKSVIVCDVSTKKR